PRTARTAGYLTALSTARAVRIPSRRRARPLFLNLQYNAPHWPWQGPGDPPYPDTMAWQHGGSPETYGRMVASMDTGIERVLQALRRHGLERDTLVFFSSDNGGERYSHMGPFSAGKMTLHEGGLRVPAMARWPGVIPAGTRTAQVAVTMDLTATFLALAGAHRGAGSETQQAVLAHLPAPQAEGNAQRRLEVPAEGRRRVPLRSRHRP